MSEIGEILSKRLCLNTYSILKRHIILQGENQKSKWGGNDEKEEKENGEAKCDLCGGGDGNRVLFGGICMRQNAFRAAGGGADGRAKNCDRCGAWRD